MRKRGKKYTAARAAVALDRSYSIEDAIPLVQKVKFAKFDETVELTLRLGVDPKHADQMVRGTVVLPHGLGKSKRVLVIASGEKQKEATEAGADFVGGEEVVDQTYDDPRQPLMDWLRQKDNPYFARALVNRVWAAYFNVGIVEPPDDMSLANPPSNAALPLKCWAN